MMTENLCVCAVDNSRKEERCHFCRHLSLWRGLGIIAKVRRRNSKSVLEVSSFCHWVAKWSTEQVGTEVPQLRYSRAKHFALFSDCYCSLVVDCMFEGLIQGAVPIPLHAWTVKVKWSRYRPCVAQRVGRGIALLFRDHGTRREWVVSSTPRPHFSFGKHLVPIVQETGWAPGPVWTGGKSRPHRDSIPDLPARSQ